MIELRDCDSRPAQFRPLPRRAGCRRWRRRGLRLAVLLGVGVAAACAQSERGGRPPQVLVPGDSLRLVDALDHALYQGPLPPTLPAPGTGSAELEPAGAGRIQVGQDQREGLFLRVPGALRFRVRPDTGHSLRFGAGVQEGFGATTFRVAVESEGRREVALEFEAQPAWTWDDRRVDLGRWAAKTITLELANPEGPPGTAAGWGTPRIVGPRPAGPSVILYLIDALRADHLGAYGYERSTSPTLDALAREGVLFERCYAQDSRTLGSVPSLLTGLYPPSHGIGRFGDELAPGTATLALLLGRAGFQTASFVTNVNAGSLPGLDRDFHHHHAAVRNYRNRRAPRTFPEGAFFAWLDENRDARFFAYVHTSEPHRPYTPPPPLDTLFNPGYRGPITGFFEGENGYAGAERARDVAQVVALYDGEIRLADVGLRRLVRGLEARDLRGKTLLVITSDHGEELRDHGGWNHGDTLYEEVLHVPLILWAPGRLPAGMRVAEPVQLVDVAPTVLSLLELPVPQALDGESLLPLIAGRGRQHFARRPVFARSTKSPVKSAVIEQGWKAIYAPGAPLELYDLAADPRERSNLAGERRERAGALQARIESWLARWEPSGARPPPPELSEEERGRLEALGYAP